MFSMKTCTASLKNTRKKALLLVLVVSMLSTVLMGAMYDSQRKEVNVMVLDDFSGVDMIKKVSTRQNTVGELLDEMGIVPDSADTVTPALDEMLLDEGDVTVRKGRNVTLEYDGSIATVITTKKKIKDVLSAADVAVNPDDIVTPSLDENVNEGDTIKVVRVTIDEQKTTESIPFPVSKVKEKKLYVGESKVLQEGVEGVKEVTTKTVYHDGVPFGEAEVTEQIISEPTEKIVAEGVTPKIVKKKATTSESGNKFGGSGSGTHKDFTYKKKFTVNASAYEPYNCGGDGRGITASGIKAQFGVVAVDPKVIPLGTKLYIESTDGGKSWTYGYCIAADTGGAIKGNKVDLCFNTRSECIKFGRRSATVYVLG